MSGSRRPFRVEMAEGPILVDEASSKVAPHLEKILDELAVLRTLVERLERTEAEGKSLWNGVETIQQAIKRTRGEIATLKTQGVKGTQLFRATDELDAVVGDTETATETILAAAEWIDEAAGKLLPQLPPEQQEIVDGIHDQAIRIFEACNFQDITGQRISKVVALLQFIEARVGTMTEIWGGIEGIAGLEEPLPEPSGDEALLNGPSLAGDAGVVSQDDIDSLFA
jgi:chemotaxis protein CheZ